MTVARVESCSKVYSDDTPFKKLTVKKSEGRIYSTDRAIPLRQWTVNQGIYNFETYSRVNSVFTDAFHLNESENVFRFSGIPPEYRTPINVWDINFTECLDTPNTFDDFYYNPLSVASSQEFYVLALGKVVYKKNNGIYKLFRVKEDIRELKINEDATRSYYLGYDSRSINSVDLSNPKAKSKTTLKYRSAEEELRTFSIQGNVIYSGTLDVNTLNGKIVQGDIREKNFKVVSRDKKGLPMNITLSKIHEDLVVVSRHNALELYDRKNFQKPLKSYKVASPKAVAFEPTGKAQLMIGSGYEDSNVRRVYFNTDMKLEEFPKLYLGRQTTSLKWLDEDTFVVGLGAPRKNAISSQRIMNVIKIVNDDFKIVAQNAPTLPRAGIVDTGRALAVDRFGDQILVLNSSECIMHYPLKKVLKKQVDSPPPQSVESLDYDYDQRYI